MGLDLSCDGTKLCCKSQDLLCSPVNNDKNLKLPFSVEFPDDSLPLKWFCGFKSSRTSE